MFTGISVLAAAINLFAAEPQKVKSIADYIGKRGTVGEYTSLIIEGGYAKYQGRYKNFTVNGMASKDLIFQSS